MVEIKSYEMEEIVGGINITAALFSSLSKAANTILDAGRALGSAIRRMSSNRLCSCR